MYIAIEKQSASYMRGNGEFITVPELLTAEIIGKDMILAFLTQSMGNKYLEMEGLTNEFKIVAVEDVDLKSYQRFLKDPTEFPNEVKAVIKFNGEQSADTYEQPFNFFDILTKSKEIKEIIFKNYPELKERTSQAETIV